MSEEWDILLPYMQCTSADAQRRTPYELDGVALNELHRRSHGKIEVLFPQWPPFPVVRRINRELEAIWDSPYAHALLVADDAMKALEAKGISVTLRGLWRESYYVYLMGMTDQEPLRELEPAAFVHAPILLQISAWDEQACRKALLLAAWKHRFSVRAQGNSDLLLLPPDQNPNPDAPVFRFLSWESRPD